MDNQPAVETQFQLAVAAAARQADLAADHVERLLARYATWTAKGAVHAGCRVTLLTTTPQCRPGAIVRIDHVFEAVAAGHELYVMGPKPVYDEYVNGHLQGAAQPADGADPFTPLEYDGRVVDSPGSDANYAPTYYRFPRPGRYEIQWRPGAWRSNILTITVRAALDAADAV